MNPRKLLLPSLLLLGAMAFAQGPNGSEHYYANANGYKGSALKTKLCKIIYKDKNPGYKALLDMYHNSDKRADGYLRDWYSNTTSYAIGGPAENHSYDGEGQSYNREHTVPQSWFSKNSPMVSDGHHVVPTDGYVNNRRGNYPFGEVDRNNITYHSNNNYSLLGRCKTPGYTGQVFEPNDEIKGDIARIYFYMATCYENQISTWSSNAEASHVFNGTKYPAFTQWQLDMLMRWSKQDPVDAVETARNIEVYKHQSNRNPFVDYPGLEEYIWGDKQNVAFNYEEYDSGIEPDPVDPDDQDNPDDPDNPDIPDNPIVQTGDTLFIETFDGSTGSGGNDGLWSGGAGSGPFESDHSGWSAAYMAGGNECARFGSGSKNGTLTSPEITIDGDYVLTFSVAPWNEETCSMTISIQNPTPDTQHPVQLTDTSFGPMQAQQWNIYQTEISGKGKFSLIFTPSQKRFFMDEVLITKKEQPEATTLNAQHLTPITQHLTPITQHATPSSAVYATDGKAASGKQNRGTYIINGRKVIRR